ncbi:MAG: hypothetical protein ACE5HT_09025 [Gemmatimonadales bacterium]
MSKFADLKDWLLANWAIKLTALVLSTALWATLAARQTTTQLVPVSLDIQAPAGRTLTAELPVVQARYSGTLRELLKLYETPPVIHKTVPDTITGSNYTLSLTTTDLETIEDADVIVQEIQPQSLTLQLDDVSRRRVRVISRVSLLPDSGYERFGRVAIDPPTVTVSGPDALVSQINSVFTVPVERRAVSAPVQLDVPIDTSGLGILRVDPEVVEVSANIGAVSESVLMGVAVSIPAGRGTWESTPSAVIVTVRGPSTRILRLTRDSVQVIARPNESDTEAPVTLEVIAPEGITAHSTPEATLVRRRNRD